MRLLFCCLLLLVAAVACASSAAPDYTPATIGQLSLLKNNANIAAIQAASTQPDGFSFIVIGDNRSGDEVFRQVIAQIYAYTAARTGTAKPIFVVHTGDIVPTGLLMEWHSYAKLREQLLLPLVHVRGNHEVIFPNGPQNYRDLVGAENWSFDYAGCRFIGLDNALDHFTDDAINFMHDSLAMSPPERIFMFFHEPPAVGRWTAHSVDSDEDGGRGGEVIAAATQAGVDAVFLGHIHLHDEMEIEGISYIISGGAGSPLHGQYGFGDVEHGFVVVTVQPDGTSWTWVPLAP
jgi:predicted phosphodiesterase